METVNIITADDILHNRTDIVTVLRDAGIQEEHLVVGKTVHRLSDSNMVSSQLLCALGLRTIGINPGVELHTTLMTLVNHPLQRIPIWRRCHPLLACQKTAPRFYLTLIERITLRTNLKDDDVHTVFLQLVELVSQRLLHPLFDHALELSVDALYPRTTHLPFLGFCHYGHHTGHHY